VRLQVCDTGVSLTAEQQYLFEPFRQAEASLRAAGHMSKPVNYQALGKVLQAVERDRDTGPTGAALSDPA
jgi:hypothetical protein